MSYPYTLTNKELTQILKNNDVNGYSKLRSKRDMIEKLIEIGYFGKPSKYEDKQNPNINTYPKAITQLRDFNNHKSPPVPKEINIDHLSNLPYELLYNILIRLKIEDIINVCESNKRLSDICKDHLFWAKKANLDLGYPIEKFLNPRVDPKLSGYEKYQIIKRSDDGEVVIMSEDEFKILIEKNSDENNFLIEAESFYFQTLNQINRINVGLSSRNTKIFNLFYSDPEVIEILKKYPKKSAMIFDRSIKNCATYNAKKLLDLPFFDLSKISNDDKSDIYYSFIYKAIWECDDEGLVIRILSHRQVLNDVARIDDVLKSLILKNYPYAIKLILEKYPHFDGNDSLIINDMVIYILKRLKNTIETDYPIGINLLNIFLEDPRVNLSSSNNQVLYEAVSLGDQSVIDLIRSV